MRPYLAVIIDSFREAMASRVLYIILVLITALLLLVVAPLGFPERAAWKLSDESVDDWPGFVAKLRAAADADEPTPGKRIWARIGDDLKVRLAEPSSAPADDTEPTTQSSNRSGGMRRRRPESDPAEGLGSVRPRELVEALNDALLDRELYDEAAWRGVKLGKEPTALLDRGIAKLSDDEVSRLNRLLLDAAFPRDVTPVRKVELRLSYFGMSLWDPLPFDKPQVLMLLKSSLTGVMNFFMGTLGVFASILVTAPIIPHTFEAGAIDLLLSKPVSRPLLFLAKFFGGCAFILINVAYFIGGLWLSVGIRFHLWHAKLLLCIPLFLFLFSIYYCVSALAGVLWRNAIVSVVVTVLFWAACSVVGFAKNVIDTFFGNPHRIVKLVPAGDSLIAANESTEVLEWRQGESKWEPIFTTGDGESEAVPFGVPLSLVGPVYDAKHDRLLAVRPPWPPSGFGMVQSPLSFAKRSDGWQRADGPPAPRETAHIFIAPDGEIILVGRAGIFRVEGELESKQDKPRPAPNPFGIPMPVAPSRKNPFAAIGPESSIWWTRKSSAAMSTNGTLAIWDGSTLTLLARGESGHFERRIESTLESENIGGLVALGGDTVLLALADGRIRTLDARDLNERRAVRPEGKNQPRSVAASPDGRWLLVVFHHRKLWLFDAASGEPAALPLAGQGDISAATFSDSNHLLVADRGTRVTEYQLDAIAAQTRHVPAPTTLERVYRYAVLPIYTVFPKPGELGNVVSYLLTDQETVAPGGTADELAASRIKLTIWPPIWSSFAFLAVVLAVTCVYIRRADF